MKLFLLILALGLLAVGQTPTKKMFAHRGHQVTFNYPQGELVDTFTLHYLEWTPFVTPPADTNWPGAVTFSGTERIITVNVFSGSWWFFLTAERDGMVSDPSNVLLLQR